MVDTIFLVRHGEAKSNVGEYFGGWLDVPLTPLGQGAGARAAQAASERGHRAASSAPTFRAPGKRPSFSGWAAPSPTRRSFGRRTTASSRACAGDRTRENTSGTTPTPTPGRPAGKTAWTCRRGWFHTSKRKYLTKEEKVLVVSHHGPIVLFACTSLGMPISKWRTLRLGNCGLCIFTKEGKNWRLKLWNSLSHYGLQNYRPLLSREANERGRHALRDDSGNDLGKHIYMRKSLLPRIKRYFMKRNLAFAFVLVVLAALVFGCVLQGQQPQRPLLPEACLQWTIVGNMTTENKTSFDKNQTSIANVLADGTYSQY